MLCPDRSCLKKMWLGGYHQIQFRSGVRGEKDHGEVFSCG
jgi:hypothetical protein